MKVAIVSYYAVTNIGDRILTESLSYLLRKLGHSSSIIDINGRYPFKFYGSLRKIEKKFAKRFIHRENDNLERYFRRRFMRHDNLHIPVAFNSCGMWGNNYDDDRVMIFSRTLAMSNVSYISLRERINEFNAFFYNKIYKKATFSCDPAAWAAEAYKIKRTTAVSNRIGINIMTFSNSFLNERCNSIYSATYSLLTSAGYDCFFFSNGTAQDYELTQSILQRMGLKKNRHVTIKRYNSGKDFLQMLSQFSFVVCTRLHTAISCYSLRIPSICFLWEEKVEEFYKSIGFPERVVKIDSLEITEIPKLVEHVITQKYNGHDFEKYRASEVEYLKLVLSK